MSKFITIINYYMPLFLRHKTQSYESVRNELFICNKQLQSCPADTVYIHIYIYVEIFIYINLYMYCVYIEYVYIHNIHTLYILPGNVCSFAMLIYVFVF